jgi:hypothetical protein
MPNANMDLEQYNQLNDRMNVSQVKGYDIAPDLQPYFKGLLDTVSSSSSIRRYMDNNVRPIK